MTDSEAIMNPAECVEAVTAAVVYPTLSLGDAVSSLSSAENVLILIHVNPDGDCVGSACALAEILRALGKSSTVASPSAIPKRLRFLTEGVNLTEEVFAVEDGGEPVPELSRTAEYDLILAVDVASPMQLGGNSVLIGEIDMMLDHHGTGEAFAPNYIRPEASAAGEIIYELYAEMKRLCVIPSLPDAARKMYAAIVSDTGSFKFSNTTKNTHLIAAELVDEINSSDDGGADTAEVCRSLFGQRTLKELTAQMLAIQNLRFYEDGALGAVLFTQKMLADAGLTEDEIGNVVDTPRGVEGVLVGISVRQTSSDERLYKISSRANAEIDCAAVCALFGGGGHTRAAGCTIEADSPEEALGTAAEAFGKAVAEYKAGRE